MDHDTLNTARADIATDLPADESECCETSCEDCDPDDDEPDEPTLLAMSVAQLFTLVRADSQLSNNNVIQDSVARVAQARTGSLHQESMRKGLVSWIMHDRETRARAAGAEPPKTRRPLLARIKAMMAADSRFADAVMVAADAAAAVPPSVPLAPEAIETVESAPKYRDDTVFLQCCNKRRKLGHRAGCSEVS